MEVTVWCESAAPPVRVFALLAAGDRWQEWAGPFVPRSRWQLPGDPIGGVGAVRRLGVGPLVSLERITAFSPGRQLSYVVDSPAPYRDYASTVTLSPLPDGGTAISWRSTFEPIVPGSGPALRWFLRQVVASFARNLARKA